MLNGVEVALIGLLCLCAILGIAFFLTYLRLIKATDIITKLQATLATPRPEALELQEFLGDILSTGGIVRVERIAPVDVLVRSTRGM